MKISIKSKLQEKFMGALVEQKCLDEKFQKNKSKNTMTKQFKHINKEKLAKLSTKKRQDYLDQQKKHLKENTGLIRQALVKGLKEGAKTL
ncbi:hypothetical protein M0R19_07875 [Candidatus Pacearchaeota archaeon]|nr:hypothetical protein [Candidatus Pacearchaeota archaeon]